MKTLLCKLMFSCLAHGPGPAQIDDLTYGVVLYQYYQDDFEAALVEAAVAADRDRRGEDPIRYELAEGSFAFNARMYAYARGIFDNLDESELSELDRMRLAFHLAREYHRRGDWDNLGEQITKVDLGRTWIGRKRVHPEVEFMRAEQAIVEGRFEEAQAMFKKIDKDDRYRAYGLYNLGIALRATGDLAAARSVFESLAELDVDDEDFDPEYNDDGKEIIDLVQRAKLAMAYISREQNSLADAETVVAKLPSEGRYRDLALATYGGLAMQQENYELAARIWLSLQNQTYWTPSTATAHLGYPISLEHLSSGELALSEYRVAEASFEQRLERLVELTNQAEDARWMRDLLYVFSAHEVLEGDVRTVSLDSRSSDPQLSDIIESWRDELGHTDWLEWLSTEAVHGLLLEWRELNDMSDWLGELPPELDAFQEIAAEQQRRSNAARSLIEGEDITARREMTESSLTGMRQRLAITRGAEPSRDLEWMLALADPEETELINELHAMRSTVGLGIEDSKRQSWLDRIDRIEGIVFWQIVDDAPTRIRAVEKELSNARLLMTENRMRLDRIGAAESNFVTGVGADFDHFRARANGLTVAVEQALVGREEALAQQIREGMQREMQQVQQYLLITRIAIARATDQLADLAPAQTVAPEDALELAELFR